MLLCIVYVLFLFVLNYRHRIQSGVWNGPLLGYYDGEGYTIRDAINYWYLNVSDRGVGVAFRDQCSGPHCSNSCPEEIVLVPQREADTWSVGARVIIAMMVLLIAVICLTMKVGTPSLASVSNADSCTCICYTALLLYLGKATLSQTKEIPEFESENPSCKS